MSTLDFKNARLPELVSLAHSFTQDDQERELRELMIELFKETLAEGVFDINVSGAKHLGSFDLVRRSVNADGLVLLQGDSEESATRYLYRAWNSRNVQGRGLHFLRTYLQLLFPNLCTVEQMWQKKDQPYPLGLVTSADSLTTPIDPDKMFLTSRVEIALDLSTTTRSIRTLTNIIRSIIPARMVPNFRFRIAIDITMTYGDIEWAFCMDKRSDAFFPWCGLFITERPSRKWRLGLEGDPDAPRLRSCRIQSTSMLDKSVDIDYPEVPRLGQPGLKLDGLWKLPAFKPFSMDVSINGTEIT